MQDRLVYHARVQRDLEEQRRRMAATLRALDMRAAERERQAATVRDRAATRVWWDTPASTRTRTWVDTGRSSTPNLTPAPFRTPAANRAPSQLSIIPQMSQAADTTRFTVVAEDIMVGQGDLDHLLVQDDLSGETLMELEERERGDQMRDDQMDI